MPLELFVKAALAGLAIAAPVGPVGLLCIQRSLRDGAAVGFASGMGAACADAIYGALAVFGVAAVTTTLTGLRGPLAAAGAALLLVLAWRAWQAPPVEQAAAAAGVPPPGAARSTRGLFGAFASVLLITLANPATIVSFVALAGVLQPPQGAGAADKLAMIAGVLIGSAAWWLALSITVARLARRLSASAQRAIQRASASMLAGFAIWQAAIWLG